ncbi:MAG TPA: hypothetical protein VM305_11045 [Candidatus Limnocylindrales bacterium]|nr:hypothetical protein [Candidatus Limnocylindrales bacterium]
MEPARIVPIRSAPERATHVRVVGERIVIERVVLADPALAAFVDQRAEDDRAELVERALRVGLLALQDASVSLDVDLVRREFESMVARTQTANEKAAEALDAVLRSNFGDQDGRLPRTLEKFLGDRGQLRRFVDELFDEKRRDSAIGRMRELLGSYFDGDASQLAQLLNPTRMGSPLHQFRVEVNEGFAKLNERLAAMEAAASARATERARSAAKGTDFESLLEEMLADLLRGRGDVLERTAAEHGDVMRSRKGDFIVTVDPEMCRGAELRLVIEAKDRAMSARAMREELTEAKRNRGAAVALVVMTPAHAPAGVAPFDIRHGDVYCVLDPEAPVPAVLDAAVRLARLLAIATLREAQQGIDGSAVAAGLARVGAELDAIRGLKVQLTSIGRVAGEVNQGLDRLREQVLARLGEVEAELRSGRP